MLISLCAFIFEHRNRRTTTDVLKSPQVTALKKQTTPAKQITVNKTFNLGCTPPLAETTPSNKPNKFFKHRSPASADKALGSLIIRKGFDVKFVPRGRVQDTLKSKKSISAKKPKSKKTTDRKVLKSQSSPKVVEVCSQELESGTSVSESQPSQQTGKTSSTSQDLFDSSQQNSCVSSDRLQSQDLFSCSETAESTGSDAYPESVSDNVGYTSSVDLFSCSGSGVTSEQCSPKSDISCLTLSSTTSGPCSRKRTSPSKIRQGVKVDYENSAKPNKSSPRKRPSVLETNIATLVKPQTRSSPRKAGQEIMETVVSKLQKSVTRCSPRKSPHKLETNVSKLEKPFTRSSPRKAYPELDLSPMDSSRSSPRKTDSPGNVQDKKMFSIFTNPSPQSSPASSIKSKLR